MLTLRTFSVFFALLPNLVAQQESKSLNPAIVAGDLVQARTAVYSHVQDLKKKFGTDPQAAQLSRGKYLYDAARGAYANWIATLHLAILGGSLSNLRSDADYKTKTTAAGKASGEFIAYVEKETGSSKALFAFASDAATIGLKIWNAVKDRQRQERTDFVADFEKLVKWDEWDAVGTAPKPGSDATGGVGKVVTPKS